MKYFTILLFLSIAFINTSQGQNQYDKLNAFNERNSLTFTENKGQWPSEVLYTTRIGGLDAWITKNGVLYDFYTLEEEQISEPIEGGLSDKFEHKNLTRYGHRVWCKYLGNNADVTSEAKEKQDGYVNYLIGNDVSKHASNVGLYKEAIVKDVYNGIDLRYYFDKGSMRYDYVVHPGADPEQINFVLKGTDKTYLSQEGNLVFSTRFGEVALAELHTYQETKDNNVASRFEKTENGWSIALGDYNTKQTLIIDPLIYSTYLGGNDRDDGHSIAVDASGQAYITGKTVSLDFDTTAGSYQTNYIGDDAFVTKLNATGTALVYSTFLGGSGIDRGQAIAIDATGNAYVMGITINISNIFNDFPITSGAFQTSHFGSQHSEIFVTKLNATGTAVVYSTFLGGSEAENGGGIAVNDLGEAYITGRTNSLDFDVTVGAYKTTKFIYFDDAFVTKLNTTGTSLVYSTYLGGDSATDVGYDIAVDASGNAYITGYSQSNDFPTTSGAFQTSYSGGFADVFVTKLNATGSSLIYSTYLGGSENDQGKSIALDASGLAHITGSTESNNFPIISGGFQISYSGLIEAFVTKLNATGTALVYSTFLGGSGWDAGDAIDVDASGNACIAGRTSSTDFDTTAGAYQTSYATGSGFDAFVSKLNATGTSLLYSTYIGGSSHDDVPSLTIDLTGNVYIAGTTLSTDFPTTSGAYQTNYGGGNRDIFVTKICLDAERTISLSSAAGTNAQTVCINNEITTITYATTNATSVSIIGLPAGVTGTWASNVVTISGSPSVSGTFNYTVSLTGNCDSIFETGSITSGCVGMDDPSIQQTIELFPNPGNTEVSIKGVFTAPIKLEVIDASGRSINANYSFDANTIRLNVSSLTNGLYEIRIVDEGMVYRRKMMVLH